MIRHTVVFRLKYSSGSPQEQDFLGAARTLSAIPEVRNFECLRQLSGKNPYHFGLSMEFANQADYDAYAGHPLHARFVSEHWRPAVAEFMEIDYQPI
jgi:hypothetical protein